MIYLFRKLLSVHCLFFPILFCPAILFGQTDALIQQYVIKANGFADNLMTDSAIVYYQRAAKFYETQTQQKPYYLLQVKLAKQHLYLKQYTQARRLLRQHLVTVEKLHIPGVESIYYQTLGETAYEEKRFKQALKLAEKAQELSPNLNLTQVDNQRLIATCKARMAYPRESLEMAKRCLEKLKQLPQNEKAKEIKLRLLLLQSRLYIDQRAFDKSLDICYEAEQLLKDLSPKKRFLNYLISIYTRQAISYKNQSKFKQAIAKYQQNIDLTQKHFGFDYDKVAFAHKLLARVFLAQGLSQKSMPRLDSSLYHLKKSADLYQKSKPVNYSELGEVYVNIGAVYQGKKQYKLTIKFYQRAYNLFKEIYGTANPHLVPLFSRWAGAAGTLKEWDKELELTQKMLIANSHQHRNLDVYTAPKINDYYNLGYHFSGLVSKAFLLCHRSQNTLDFKQSLRHSLMADSLIKYYYKSVFRKNDRLLVARYINALNVGRFGKNVLYACNALYQRTNQKAYIDTAFYFIERGNASYLMSTLAESNAKKFADISPELLQREAYLRKKVAKYQNLAISKPNQQIRDSLIKFNLRYETLIHQLEQQYPKYARLKFDTKQVGITQLQTQLKPGEALLGYSLNRGNNNYVLLITKNQARLIHLPFPKKLEEYTNLYYQKLQSEARLQPFAETSNRLYQLLFKPIEKYLKDIDKLVVIAPSLESAPFEAMVTKLPSKSVGNDFSKLDYLNNRFQISYHYSATLWHQSQLEKTKPQKVNLVAFAPFSGGKGNVYSTTRGSGLSLPESKVEVSAIFNLCKAKGLKAEVNLSTVATKERFVQTVQKANIIHIASHSEANRKNSGLAKIRFAGCGNNKDVSGCLLASEVYNLELNADLLVLSSCESGVGKLIKGEGVFSLARSFLYAGAHNIVFSLWEIDDVYTRKLMIAFYKQFLGTNGVSYSAALQAAQQKLMRQGVHPKHWAGIVMIGK
ncbi:hypothetical protein BKI52_41290 [marine bacterium AO1-C]|nr:hypothetical protein BKI52_41290 [marine bacterium AO1-C]